MTEGEVMFKWGEVVRLLWEGQCCIRDTQCSGVAEAHHLIPKGHKLFRYDPRNGVLACSFHHRLSFRASAHNAPDEFYLRLSILHPEIKEWRDNNLHAIAKHGDVPSLKDMYRSLVETEHMCIIHSGRAVRDKLYKETTCEQS